MAVSVEDPVQRMLRHFGTLNSAQQDLGKDLADLMTLNEAQKKRISELEIQLRNAEIKTQELQHEKELKAKDGSVPNPPLEEVSK
jgi:predicted  nucleic acid-binding Zn-ribbon protein